MKKLLYLFMIFLTLAACGNKEESVDSLLEKGDLSEIKEKKAALSAQQKELNSKIDKLNTFIEKKERHDRALLVSTQKIHDTVFKHFVEVQGNVRTDQNIIIYPEFSGVLTNVYVNEGQRVSKGQRLAKIDDGGLSSQLAQQETQVALAKTTFERQKRLWDQKIGSEIQFLEAKATYEAADKAAQQIRSQLAKTVITAPFSGVVDNVIADQGQVVNQGQTQVIRLVNLSDMYVKASMPETYLNSIEKGTEVNVRLASIGEEYKGTVRQASNYINPDNRTFDVRIAIPNKSGKVKPNLIATVEVNDYTNQNAITVPESILQENSKGESIVFVYEPKTDSTGTAKRKIVEPGLTYGNKVEIKNGLKEGETIIVEGAKSVRDGQKVTYKN
ncbi:efflux RND transporter periplasmic adaptor subunit [Marixanthomonas spongiae]|uniref:Efflux RND transporter periplasmic adaptor subunit n=1 Tax=Marixanthomonas spongiae TaxID=2174845 RepID=A0A2U0HZG3_9FLAO|nr:efflux RND transporter periplasmic adaptor subunit [Marixanthomonas spongiae]PVW14271.1 efflux RND transporter periplasmic adaptor subunit [Marixanthomonas spongiae]